MLLPSFLIEVLVVWQPLHWTSRQWFEQAVGRPAALELAKERLLVLQGFFKRRRYRERRDRLANIRPSLTFLEDLPSNLS